MREILFKAKAEFDKAWHIGYVCYFWDDALIFDSTATAYKVDPETVCQFTGAYEFDVSDPSVNGRIFENDIVEIWTRRHPTGEGYWTVGSKYDGPCIARALVVFHNGQWKLDYNNPFNEKTGAARGKEQYDRWISGPRELYDFGSMGCKNVDRFREHNPKKNWYDIKVIGNLHDNPELLRE